MQRATEDTFVKHTHKITYGCDKRQQYETKNTTLSLIFPPIKIPITKRVAHEDGTSEASDPVTQELSAHALPNYIITFSQYYKYSFFPLPSSVCINW